MRRAERGRDPLHVAEIVAPFAQRRILAGHGRGSGDFVGGKASEFQFRERPPGVGGPRGQLVFERACAFVGGGDGRAPRERDIAGERVEQVELVRAREEPLLFVLPDLFDEQFTDGAQLAGRREPAVDARRRFARHEHLAPQDRGLARLRLEALRFQARAEFCIGVDFERHARARGTAAHDVGRRAFAEHEGERAEQHRFSGARLAAARGEPRGEFERGPLDQREVLDLQAREPARLSDL